MQKDLPRPAAVDYNALIQASAEVADPAEALIAREAALLMAHDATKYPIAGADSSVGLVDLPQIDDKTLAEARLQILTEVKDKAVSDQIQSLWEKSNSNSLLLGLGCYDDDDEDDQVSIMQSTLDVHTPFFFPSHLHHLDSRN